MSATTSPTGRPRRSPTLKLVPEDHAAGPAVGPLASTTAGAPIKPDGLSADASEMWDLVVSQMASTGLLRPLSGPALEVACETFAQWREAVRLRRERGLTAVGSQGVGVGPWVRIEQQAGKEFRGWCAEYGITPAAERKLAVETSADDSNPYA